MLYRFVPRRLASLLLAAALLAGAARAHIVSQGHRQGARGRRGWWSGGGCFIATAAYGSQLHPHVEALRAFRDERLLTNAPGRAFVELYYATSSPLVDVIAEHPSLRAAARLALAPLVYGVIHPQLSAVFWLAVLALALRLRSLRRRRLPGVLHPA